jgi:voltage-gated potassium channel
MIHHLKIFLKEITYLVRSPFFILLTIVGNAFILFCSYLFWVLESGENTKLEKYIDAIWWAFSTATTTGYGDITPVTNSGKLLGIFLMLIGLALFAMYTALFAETIIQYKELFLNKKSHLKK